MAVHTIKLFTIPFSGGNAYSYSALKKHLPSGMELCTLELPGRGKRITEPLLYTIDAMTEDLFNQVEADIDGSYVIFGHSLGALLGLTLCRQIAAQGRNLPLMLFLSGMTAPALVHSDQKHLLPDNAFVHTLREMGGTPEELLTDTSFLQFFLPVVRADFQSIAEYTYSPKQSPLDVPITVMLGTDEDVTNEDAAAWQQETDSGISIHRFTGGHFYFYDHVHDVCTLIADKASLAQELQDSDVQEIPEPPTER